MIINLDEIMQFFDVIPIEENRFELWRPNIQKPLIIEIPFHIDRDIARLYGMVYDGSLSKKLYGISFSQKKDTRKSTEFADIIQRKFGIDSNIIIREDEEVIIQANSKALGCFLYCLLDFYKCDEFAKVPNWIKDVSDELVKEYLRYAFAMEGSVSEPFTGKKEIKFHSCSELLVDQLKQLLKDKYNINFKKLTYYIKGYGEKYYLYTYKNKY
ncbi:MAG: hypothetical protein Q8Q35_03100 [Nanoarchaeota archaeon]|nr:hypothetical protein [Nanoarchaeota archaeon]